MYRFVFRRCRADPWVGLRRGKPRPYTGLGLLSNSNPVDGETQMRRNKFFNGIVFSVLVTAVGGILSAVQEPPPPPDGPNKHMAMRIAVGDMEFNDKLVKGAPF